MKFANYTSKEEIKAALWDGDTTDFLAMQGGLALLGVKVTLTEGSNALFVRPGNVTVNVGAYLAFSTDTGLARCIPASHIERFWDKKDAGN